MNTLHLWLLECRDDTLPKPAFNLYRLFTFYAASKLEAECIVKEHLALHPNLAFIRLDEKPEGFVFVGYRRPGSVTT